MLGTATAPGRERADRAKNSAIICGLGTVNMADGCIGGGCIGGGCIGGACIGGCIGACCMAGCSPGGACIALRGGRNEAPGLGAVRSSFCTDSLVKTPEDEGAHAGGASAGTGFGSSTEGATMLLLGDGGEAGEDGDGVSLLVFCFARSFCLRFWNQT